MAVRSVRWAIGKVRRRRYRPFEQRGEHAVLLHSAHDFGIMIYATTPSQIRRQLADAGFSQDMEILRADGRPTGDDMEATNEYFHVLARKP